MKIKDVILISRQKINRNLTTIMILDKFMLGPNFMGKEKPLVSGEELQVKSIDKTTKIDVTVNKDELMTKLFVTNTFNFSRDFQSFM